MYSGLKFRPSKNLKRGLEMPDVVGVVQPKPRDIPAPEWRRKTASKPATAFQTQGPRYARTVSNIN